jgi:hypothetical protein
MTDDELVFAIFKLEVAAPSAITRDIGGLVTYLGTDPPDGAAQAAEGELSTLPAPRIDDLDRRIAAAKEAA